MFWFKRTSPFDDPELGRYTRAGKIWYPSFDQEGLGIVICGGKFQPNPNGIEVARRLLREASRLIPIAETFVKSDLRAVEFAHGHGLLKCDGFIVYESGEFAVEFSLSDWPDAMISVPFKEGAPFEVQLDD